MKRRIAAVFGAVMMLGATSGAALAAKCKGTVASIEDGKMVVELKGKCKAKVGDQVKIKVKKKAAVEGC